ncbi:hypothetical protein BC826DRAFT_1055728, partial [Russula brevipes]
MAADILPSHEHLSITSSLHSMSWALLVRAALTGVLAMPQWLLTRSRTDDAIRCKSSETFARDEHDLAHRLQCACVIVFVISSSRLNCFPFDCYTRSHTNIDRRRLDVLRSSGPY